MPERYFIDCPCGQRIPVELFEAGTTKSCRSCNASVVVPNTTILKERSGDRYPTLRPIEKIERSLIEGESPFDGFCHVCGDVDATTQTPIIFDAMMERVVQDEGGIRPTLTGVKLVAGAAEEHWQRAIFPLLLCTRCDAKFQKAKSYARTVRIATMVVVLTLFCLFLGFAFFNAEVVAACVGLLGLLGAIAWITKVRQTKTGEMFLHDWLKHIRWAPEAIAAVDDYQLTIGPTQPFERQ